MVSHTTTKHRRYPTISVADAHWADGLDFLKNTTVLAKYLIDSLLQVVGNILFHVNTNKTEMICFKRE